MFRPHLNLQWSLLILILLLSGIAGPLQAQSTSLVGKFATYRISAQFELSLPISQLSNKVAFNVTEMVVHQFQNDSVLVNFTIQSSNPVEPMQLYFPNGSLIFPYLSSQTLSSPNSTLAQVTTRYNLTYIQTNRTNSTPFALTRQQITFNGTSYIGNSYSGGVNTYVNASQALNVTQPLPLLLPLNLHVAVMTFPSDLVYNLTATSPINFGGGQAGSVAYQMTLLRTNLSLGEPIQPLHWYAALIIIVPLALVGYWLYRKRRSQRVTAKPEEKPSYWVH